MSAGYRIAVVGATGVVGATVLELLSERAKLPIQEVVPFASERSLGKEIVFAGERLRCRVLSHDAIHGFDLVFSSAGGGVSSQWAPRFRDAGAIVIDKSSSYRMHTDVPLVVPEVNPDALHLEGDPDVLASRIISSPNCSTMQMVVALNPIRLAVGLREIIVSTYQSVSGTGRNAIEELTGQTQAVLDGTMPVAPHVYPHPIAFNVLPQVETFDPRDDGYTTEETKMMNETRKIFGQGDLAITATCARVPVISCHSESIRIETEHPLSVDDCKELLRGAPGVELVDDPALGAYPMPSIATGRDEVFVGRIRPVAHRPTCLALWVVGDNLRKGAATNAIQIAEYLHENGLVGSAASRQRFVTV